MWAKIKGKKRCVVPVNGYYEWMKKGNHRIPYYTKHKSDSGDKYSPSIFLLAGLYDCTTIIDDEPSKPAEATSGNETIVHLGKDTMQGPRTLYTFTIVTTNSNRQLSFLHDRMPVILDSKEDVETWLDPSIDWDSKVLGRLLKPYEAEVDCYQVPTEVGKIGMNDPSFVRPVSQRKDGIEAMFMKQKAKAASLSPQKQSLKAVKEEKHVAIDFPDNVKSESDTEIKQEDSKHTVQSTSSAKLKRKFSPAARDESPDSSDTPQEESKPSTSKAPPSTPKKRLKTEPSSPNKGTTSKKASGSPTKPPSKAKGKAPATPSKKKATITDFFSKVS
ncbi:hypothetical protein FRC03_004705 [Tulasnella sp. 419]|nr:hypothetical protein FRC03_004705 [Tulasnella sp. 419]